MTEQHKLTKPNRGKVMVRDQIQQLIETNRDQWDWGRFGEAIARWEWVIGHPVPSASKPDGKNGKHRMSSSFTEWMMGLDPGWVTGHGLTRPQEMRLIGNGVVPQQAEHALRILVDRIGGIDGQN